MSILEKLFGGTLNKKRGHLVGGTQRTPLKDLPVRPYRELAEVGASHGSPFAAAIEGELNAEEYLKLDNGVDDDVAI